MAIHLTLLVDSPAKRAHGNAASRLALGLAQTGGVEPTILCYGADAPPPWLPPEVTVERLGTDRVTRSLPPLTRYLLARQPDVLVTRQVHANFVGLAAAAAAKLTGRWRGKLVLVQDHPIALSHAANWRDNKWLAKLSYRFADGVISPSPVVRDDIIRWCGLAASATALIPNPIPKFSAELLPPPHPWLRNGEPPVFVHTSNMTPWKRTDLLLQGFADLSKRHEARLLIVGDGPGRPDAAAQIRELNLGDRAATVGWVEDPLQYAARAHAFVLPSDEEGFAQVLTEAMSVGCPVIATDATGGGPRFVTGNGTYGLLIPMRNQAELTAAMERMLRPDVRARYSELGLERAQALSPEACARLLTDFLADRFGL
jgi:glycosyltransferase involved in cell wall biosynthesis